MIKLINEKTKEIVVFGDGVIDLAKIGCKNVAEMIEAGWKDYKEPEGIKSIEARYYKDENKVIIEYSSAEEVSDSYEKARAWKRLKDKGFAFRWIDMQTGQIKYSFFLKNGQKITHNDEDDLLLLFRGEE